MNIYDSDLEEAELTTLIGRDSSILIKLTLKKRKRSFPLENRDQIKFEVMDFLGRENRLSSRFIQIDRTIEETMDVVDMDFLKKSVYLKISKNMIFDIIGKIMVSQHSENVKMHGVVTTDDAKLDRLNLIGVSKLHLTSQKELVIFLFKNLEEKWEIKGCFDFGYFSSNQTIKLKGKKSKVEVIFQIAQNIEIVVDEKIGEFLIGEEILFFLDDLFVTKGFIYSTNFNVYEQMWNQIYLKNGKTDLLKNVSRKSFLIIFGSFILSILAVLWMIWRSFLKSESSEIELNFVEKKQESIEEDEEIKQKFEADSVNSVIQDDDEEVKTQDWANDT